MNDDLNTSFCTPCGKNCNCHKFKSVFENSLFSLWQEDMSEFKSKIDALKKEIGLENIRERLNDMNLLKDLAKSIKLTNINTKTLDLHGAKSKSELEHFISTFTNTSIETFKDEIMAVANEDKTFNQVTQVKKMNGELVDIIINICFPENAEDFDHVIVSFTDVTKTKKLEKEIQKNKDTFNENLMKFKNLLEINRIAYLIMDSSGVIKEANSVFVEIIGCEKIEKIIGIKIQNLVSKEDCEKITKSLYKIGGAAIEDMEVCIDNSLFSKKGVWIRINANSIENGNKTVFCIIKDITDKKIEEFKKYITNEKSKDKIRQNITRIRNKLQNIKEGGS